MIREAGLDDALSIHNIEQLCFNTPYSLTMIQSDLSNDKVKMFVYQKNDKVIGYISVYYFLGEANLQKIAVFENERNNGIASDLIEFASKFLKENDIKTFYLEVNENNSIAIKVYEKLGFKKITTRKNYYGSDSAIIFEKSLM